MSGSVCLRQIWSTRWSDSDSKAYEFPRIGGWLLPEIPSCGWLLCFQRETGLGQTQLLHWFDWFDRFDTLHDSGAIFSNQTA